MPTKILVVDDEPDLELLISQKFRREIRKQELSFEFAGDGLAALEKLRQNSEIDVMLTDINMPEMTGLELLQELRGQKRTLKAIVLSAYGDIENIRSAMNLGAFDFLTKPIDFEDLKITLKKTIEYVKELKSFETAQEEKLRAQEEALLQEKKAQEAQQELIRSLRKMDKLKDEFLANTSHELRTPLNGIIGIVESLLDGVSGSLNENTKRNLTIISSSGRRLSRLIDDILDFSKIKSGDIVLMREPVNLLAAVETVLTLSAPLVRNKKVKLRNQVSQDLPALFCDPNRLQQILFNLVGNAIKFTDSGNVVVTALPRDQFVLIQVKDTGIGIPEESLEDVFKMFRQVEHSATRSQGGAGLGLAITKDLIELQGGTIQVSSQVGTGSIFSFTVPLTKEAPRESRGLAQIHPTEQEETESFEFQELSNSLKKEGNYKILVVDDEPINQQVIANHFIDFPYQLIHVMNGTKALKLVAGEDSFDLVLLDVMMPGLSGYEVCQKIRESFSLFELPVLMLTAKSQMKDFIQGLDSGANDYLTKPFDKRELQARVRTLLTLKDAVGAALTQAQQLRQEQRRTKNLQTERTALEHRARDSARAEAEAKEASQQKTDFLALMSHELRTPLNAIIGYSEIIHEDMKTADQSEFIPDISKIQNSAKHLLSLINNLLDLTKMEAGKMDMFIEEFKVSLLLDEVAHTLRPLVKQNDNRFIMSQSDAIRTMQADITKLRIVLFNLLSNANKFTKKGTVSLNVEPCHCKGVDSVKFEIQDNGIGMSKEQLSRVFEPFTQADKSTTRHYGGSGLGLVITQKFCTMMEGFIDIESTPGEGTTIAVTLPVVSPLGQTLY